MDCCPNCFTHQFLKDYIKKISKSKGRCSHCHTRDTKLCNPSALSDLFRPIFDLYIMDSGGKQLHEVIQSDWQLFTRNVTSTKRTGILFLAGEDDALSDGKFKPALSTPNTVINKWDRFVEELKHENRFFPKEAINTDDISELLNYLIMPKKQNPKTIYRARINRENTTYPIAKMGKPPAGKVQDGRANPKGISYFYGASDYQTAIAETRPYKSETVVAARFQLSKNVTILDLRAPRSTISPFGLDEDNLELLYQEHMPFLCHLGNALSTPVLPYKKDLEYLATQYLCELIKDRKFDGIAFKSSLAKGDNYVFFNDSHLTGTKVETYSIKDSIIKPIKVKFLNEKT